MGKLKRQLGREGNYLAYADAIGEIELNPSLPALDHAPQHKGFSYAFWTRMVFSCLVDADYLDTEAFMRDEPLRTLPQADLRTLLGRLEARLGLFGGPKDALAVKRKEVLEACMTRAAQPRGLFSLTVPTGGGKTLSSLAFALNHAVQNGLRRVIYVIPYTSIIDQTAKVFREALGPENVLEHHSNARYDGGDEDRNVYRLAAENWDLPIVVTTNVQFFESLFGHSPSSCRKLHNIANSVVIFDEAQMFPIDLMLPCIRAIEELVRNYRCTAVLCSATQPALDGLFDPPLRPREICADHKALYAALRRVRFAFAGEMTDAELIGRLNATDRALCIVNTRAQAQALYHGLAGDGRFHLSTLMTPEHRKAVLEVIRARLIEGLPCRVVSTSLIEAGVDVDFPCVFREEAGIDSIVQAAGRCNREGRLSPDDAVVYVFRPEERYVSRRAASLRQPVDVARSVAKDCVDIASPEAIQKYFTALYAFRGEALDAQRIVHALDACARNGLMIPFAQVARQFRVIDAPTRPVLVALDDGARGIAEALKRGVASRRLMREAARHSVSLYEGQFNALRALGALELVGEGIAVLRDTSLYSNEIGLRIPDSAGVGIYA